MLKIESKAFRAACAAVLEAANSVAMPNGKKIVPTTLDAQRKCVRIATLIAIITVREDSAYPDDESHFTGNMVNGNHEIIGMDPKTYDDVYEPTEDDIAKFVVKDLG